MPSKKGKKKNNNKKKNNKKQEPINNQQPQEKQEQQINNSTENEIENQKSLSLETQKTHQDLEQDKEEPKDELLKNPLSQEEINTNDEELPDLVPDSELEPIPELSFNEEFNFGGEGFDMGSEQEEEEEGEQDWDFAKHAKNNEKREEVKQGIMSNINEYEEEDEDEDDEEDIYSSDEEDDDDDEENDENSEEEEEEDNEDDEEEEEEEEGNDDGDVTRAIDISGKEKMEDKRKKDSASNTEENGYDREFFDTAPDLDYNVTFDDLNLSRPLRAAIDKLGYIHPTPIQAQSIPILLEGRDMCASAMTGSGKTAAFLLPTMERLLYRSRNVPASRVLVMLPTRELAVQCFSMAEKLGQLTDIRSALICGGLPRSAQEQALLTKPDIIIATPGRIIDHLYNSKSFNLVDIQVLILDEADRLLEMGFYDQLLEIVKSCPRDRQTMLFSATMTDKVDSLAGLSLKRPIRISVDNRDNVAQGLTQDIIKIGKQDGIEREANLMALCTRTFKHKVLIFCNFRRTVDRLDVLFRMNNLRASSLHGLMSQDLRLVALDNFKKGASDFLIATDVASRGLDIKGVQTVINFEMPDDLASYIHRVGRTARAGKEGVAVSICDASSRSLLKKVIRNAHKKESPIRYRDVPSKVMQHWHRKLSQEEKLIEEEVEMKKVERKMEENEMYRKKADNIAKYRDQILSRPQRGWFKDPKREEEEKREMSKKHRMKDAKKRAKEMIQEAQKKNESEEERTQRLKKEFMKKWKAENRQRKAQQRESRKQRQLKEFKEATGYDDMKEFFKEAKEKHREDPNRFKKVQQKRREKKKQQRAKAKRAKQQEKKKEDNEGTDGMTRRKRKAMKQGGRPAKYRRRK